MSSDDNSPELPRGSRFWHCLGQAWPWVIVALGVAFSTAWLFILAYELVKLIALAI